MLLIASLDGTVSAVFADSLILEVGGVGYRVFAAPSVLAGTPVGGRLKLFTHHLVREDLQALYGFRSPEELGFFGVACGAAMMGMRPIVDVQYGDFLFPTFNFQLT